MKTNKIHLLLFLVCGCVITFAADKSAIILTDKAHATTEEFFLKPSGSITNVSIPPEKYIEMMRKDGSITNVVNMLVANGTFCQVRGHKWELGCSIQGCLVNHTGVLMRHCSVCNTTQTQKPGEWQSLDSHEADYKSLLHAISVNKVTNIYYFPNGTK